MCRSRGVPRTILVVLGLVLAGCGVAQTASTEPWGADGEAWLDAFVASRQTHAHLMAPFLQPSLTYDHAVIQGFSKESRWDTVASYDAFFDGGAEEITVGSPYLDPHGVAYAASVDLDDWPSYAMLELLEIDGGEASTMWHARASALHDDYAYPDDHAAHVLARAYVDAYDSADPSAVTALYTTDAVVTDGLLALAIPARDDPAGLLDGTPALTLDTQAQHHTVDATVTPDAPAVYVHRRGLLAYPIDTVWMFVTTVDACPGAMAIALEVDETMSITAERRLHSLESARACYDRDDLADGWWTGVQLPLPFGERVTGTVTSRAGHIEIRNGGDELNAAVRRALGLFSWAELPAPTVDSITFDPYHADCADRRGYSDWSSADLDIHLCMDVDTVHWTVDSARQSPPDADDAQEAPPPRPPAAAGEWNLLVHELAHAWMRAHLDDDTRAAIVAMTGTSSWNDHADPWVDRGIEWAAEGLRWGLMGDPQATVLNLDSPDCATLSAIYETVTASPPSTSCPRRTP